LTVKRKSTHSDAPGAPVPRQRKPLDAGRKLDIIGILMMVSAVFLFLALVSHSAADEGVSDIGAIGILKLFGGDPEVQARADVTHNWLGLIGALIARFFILLTVGYFALAFPVLLGIWGWFVLRRHDLRALAYYTNYALLVVFLASTFTGLLRLVAWLPQIPVSWAGNIGDFMAGIVARLIGTTGGILAILASLLIIAVIVVDYDIRITLERLGSIGRRLAGMLGRRAAAIPAAAQTVATMYEEERQRSAVTQDVAESAPSSAPSATPPPATRTSRFRRGAAAGDAVPVTAVAPVAPAASAQPQAAPVVSAASPPAVERGTPISIEWPAGANALPAAGVKGDAAATAADVPPVQVYASAATESGALRSNGVISRDSIPRLRELDKQSGDDSDVASGMSASVAATSVAAAATAHASSADAAVGAGATAVSATVARAAGAGVVGNGASGAVPNGTPNGTPNGRSKPSVRVVDEDDVDDVGDQDVPPFDLDEPVFVNEHEKKAVQQAVARRMAEVESDSDTESMNIRTMKETFAYRHPAPSLLDPVTTTSKVTSQELHRKAELVKEKLAIFGIDITSISVVPGPVVTQFELVPDSAVKISKIVSLADDLALALAARGIRIIAPIPGKSAVGIEIPNNEPEFVHFRSVVESEEFTRSRGILPLGMGKDIKGKVTCADLARMPHLLIAGATGSGKSVGLNAMITSLLFAKKPWEVKFVMIDPKKIELAQYRGLSRHFLAVSPDINEEIVTDPANAVIVLKSLELEMDKRYTKLAKAGVRHVNDYNAKVAAGEVRDAEMIKHYKLPHIVVVIDELADLMITAAREVEEPIARLAQLARAVGIHLIVATQRPSVDVLTGVIKANFSARVAFQTASRIDSRTILDGPGADQLLGNGDMLYLASGSPKPERIQNAFLSTAEVERVVEYISEQKGHVRPYQLPSVKNSKKGNSREDSVEMDDLLYEAARLIVRHQQGSVSLLQRRLKIGYSRAARIVDQLEVAGIVGPYDGSKAREVLVEDPDMLEEILQTI
jgi:DNA segregation ATPase FtsK/SpoIIIE-like protein